MCKEYEYQFGIGNMGSGEVESKKSYQFYDDNSARRFMNRLNEILLGIGKEVNFFNKVPIENPYHIVNRLCESLQETLARRNLRCLRLSDEVNCDGDIRKIVTIEDDDFDEEVWTEVDITGLEGVEIINAIMKAL